MRTSSRAKLRVPRLLQVITLSLALSGGALTVAKAAPEDESLTTASNLNPVPVTILQAPHDTARGLVFIAPKGNTATNVPGSLGPEIIDDHGRPYWFYPLDSGDQATDFRVQIYRGQPVLTWWQGQSHNGVGHGEGIDYIVDHDYHVIATVAAGHGLDADSHEFVLTPEGTALITSYHQVPYDLSSVGGAANGSVLEGVAQEIDVATGRVVFEWHSLDHVGVDESQVPVPTDAATAHDYFHINAVNLDNDGNLLISSRNTWTVYKVDRHTGAVFWRIGGKKTDYRLADGVAFAYQHNALPDGFDTFRIFDNESQPNVDPPSKVKWIHRDPLTKVATLLREFSHPDGLVAGSQGNTQHLANGDTFVNWGALGRFSEFDPSGALIFDASLPAGYDNYRAYRHAWIGTPHTHPTASVTNNTDGTSTVHAIWNGATEVDHWQVLGGASTDELRPIGSAEWNGLDTSITLQQQPAFVALRAFDAAGHVIGKSQAVAIGD